MKNYQHLVIVGNPVDGLFFYGPFIDADSAGDWAERKHRSEEWWIADLNSPDITE